ncbi:MAG: tetratricopeptide repeat protein [Candidatus Riflebacteria bacterium]|nr:tetratricopeptide repeat protein [Candidatus Riflebacteria bacterium]
MLRRIIFTVFVAIPALMLLTGCGGGVAGEGTNSYTQTSGTPIVRSDSFNDKGWNLIAQGQYDSAVSAFNQVLSDSPNADEISEANNGLGWARSHLGSLADGIPWFEKAISTSNDAKVGLAAAYIQKGSKTDLENVIDLIYKKIGGENPHFHYVPRRATGVTDAECHALLAFAMAGVGRNDDATAQIEYAKELNPGYASTTIDQLGKMVDFMIR